MSKPYTLLQALKNGLNEAAILKLSEEATAHLLKLHVLDMEAEIFTDAFIEEEKPSQQLSKVWARIKAA